MKYFFVNEKDGSRHIIIAKDLESAKQIIVDSVIDYIYELKADTFEEEGFLISDLRD